MICAILLSALLSPHAAGYSPAYNSQLHPQQYKKKKRKSLPYGAPWDQIWSTEASRATLHCIWTPSRETAKKPFFIVYVLYSAPACNESWSLQVEGLCKRPKVNGRPSGGLPLSPYWESALQSAITFPLAMLLHSAHSHCPPTPKIKKLSRISRGRGSHTAAV